MLSLRDATLPDPHWIDFVLQHIDPTLSVTRTLARLEAIRVETPDMKSFVLRPAAGPIAFAAGQSLPVRVTLGGVVHERHYSPTSAPGDPTLVITVKRHREGTVSRWLHDRAAIGDVLELGAASGNFTLPSPPPARLLFIAAGSGITAVHAVLTAALRARHDADVVLLYYARRPADLAFAEELRGLALRHSGLRIHFLTQRPADGAAAAGHFSAAHLDAWAVDYAERQTFVCGPAGLMRAVSRHWADAAVSERLYSETFAPPIDDDGAAEREAMPVHFRRSARTVALAQPTLLAIAEAAGLRPPTGCRMGICRTCTCTKVSGAVRDRITGAVDSTAGSRIRLCVSEPLGPVTLDL
ncbi:MAG: ferredoxin reductase [Deltaproteobacteria bacterium]|nr:ferredoxin reductase [Deltaproteobacteria bacterium]